MEPLPQGCLTADRLHGLAKMLNKLEGWARRQGIKSSAPPCLRLIQGSRDSRITALVEVGDTTLKLQMKNEEWIVLGDALKVSD